MDAGILSWLLTSIGIDGSTRFGESIHFFFYDSIKILFLLGIMIFFIGVLRTYIPEAKLKRWLVSKNRFISHLTASMFGAITPFCSCSSIPAFIGFIEAGVPLGVSLSFLITSPIVNEYLIVLMLAFFGWKITLAYALFGILIGTFAGMLLGTETNANLLEKTKNSPKQTTKKYSSFFQRINYGFHESEGILKRLWVYILIGVAIGAIVHNLVPETVIHTIASKSGFFAVPLAVLIGIPLYANCAAIVPVAVALFQKGFPLGTALAFMMASSALSFPEAIILRRIMKLRLIAYFFASVGASITLTGYLFNVLQKIF